jgi:hypothetical protein
LVGNLLVIESLPSATRDYILARSEGNPLFVEEVIRMLIDRGLIRRDGERWIATKEVAEVDIPDTIHGLLLCTDRPTATGNPPHTARRVGDRATIPLQPFWLT